jgi:pimeloyl-ACP methyl ester carboxylesterase
MKELLTKAVGLFINITAFLFPKWSTDYSFDLLCKVKRVGISEKGQAFFDKAESVSLENGNQNTVLHRWGTGDKNILFLHGWMSNSQRWLPYVERLDLTEYTVYALDAPGHGMSKGTRLNLEIFRQGIARAIEKIGHINTMVSHSFGSLATCYTFLEKTDIPVEKFAIMGAPSGMDAIFVYFKEILSLKDKALSNLSEKIDTILKVPANEISMQQFFQKAKQPLLVVHEISDKITPFGPIQKATTINLNIETFFTKDQDHNLKGEATVTRVVQFINS